MKKTLCSLLVLASFSMSACSSIRMRYEADFKTPDGKEGEFVYEESYDVGSYPALCGLTAIFLGGACWFYTVMPTVNQKSEVKRDALKRLNQELKSQPEITADVCTQVGWGDKKETSSVTMK